MLGRFEEQLFHDLPNIRERNLYLAISGGKDSMVLSHLLIKLEINHTLLHCNFHLRGEESDQDQEFLEKYAKRNELKIKVQEFDTLREVELRNGNIQLTARELRYEWFHEIASKDGSALILTAHHLDDSIETLFINLLRGTGINGITGIPKLTGPFIRPLLSFSVDEILKYADDNNIDYREDSSNRKDKYLRNNIRHNLIPMLLDLEPNVKLKLKNFFDETVQIQDYIELNKQLLREKYNLNSQSIEITEIQELSDVELRLVFYEFGISRTNLGAFKKFLNSQTGSIFHTQQFEFNKDRSKIFWRTLSTNQSSTTQFNELPFEVKNNDSQFLFETCDVNEFVRGSNPLFLDLDKIQMPMTLRKWQKGDRIQPLGMHGTKLISDILIDHKFSAFEKDSVFVLKDSSSILAVLGLMISDGHKVSVGSSRLLRITKV